MSICLCMIVKDEASIIKRCLDSARPVIDSWCIVDTGSTDGTQDLIREHMSGLHGDLHERQWVDFAHNRTEALELARPRADWLLLLDADQELVPGESIDKTQAHELMCAHVEDGTELEYARTVAVSTKIPWRYIGKTHEYIDSYTVHSKQMLPSWKVIHRHDTSKNAAKFARDIALLEAAIAEDPSDTRARFYLAQSYRDVGAYEKARRHYSYRARLHGWAEEEWYSLFQLGMLDEMQGIDPTESYLKAFENRPSRAEPMVELARWCREHKRFELCYRFASIANNVPLCQDTLFVDRSTTWRAIDEMALGAFYTGRKHEFRVLTKQLLAICPEHARARIEDNARFA